MRRLSMFAQRAPVAFSFAAVIVYLAIIMLGNVVGDSMTENQSIVVEGGTRVVIAALAAGAVVLLGCRTAAGLTRADGIAPWAMIVVPTTYLCMAYPYLFTGSMGPNMKQPAITALVAADSFCAGFAEEIVFRGLVMGVLLTAWRDRKGGIARAILASSVLFAVPHLLNIFSGHQPLRAGAQVVWSFLLGASFAVFAYATGTVWPVAFAHGILNAVVSTNRMGLKIEIGAAKAAAMMAVPLPIVIYAIWVYRDLLTSFRPLPAISPPGSGRSAVR